MQNLPAPSPRTWWHHATFYQVYIRSFADSDGDGVGDIGGIRARLPYLVNLGVNAIWINPFYPSPQADHGYDVADYMDIEPEYGTLVGFDALVEDAHGRGLKVILDIVPNHTSDRHRWFQNALSSRDHPDRAKYHFADPRPDGGPPNNWTSAFGGPAWTLDEKSGQYYLHLFAPEQPDLNWWEPSVHQEFEGILRFWFDRGVDGFRIDVADLLYKAHRLPNSPPGKAPPAGAAGPNYEFRIGDQEEVHEVYRAWRRLADSYEPRRVFAGEIWLAPDRTAQFLRPGELHMAFTLMDAPWDALAWRARVDAVIAAGRANEAPVATWMQSNHDTVRHLTRLGGGVVGTRRARAALLFLLALPGPLFVYQGEELGLPEAEVTNDMKQDPQFIRSGGTKAARDGCRVPLPWAVGQPNSGFSTGEPWLPQPAGWDAFAADRQEGDAASMLAFYRRALALRGELAPSLDGDFRWRDAPAGCTVLERHAGSRGHLLAACNFSASATEIPVEGEVLLASDTEARVTDGRLALPADSAALLWRR